MRLKRPIYLVSIVFLIGLIFTFNHDVKKDASINRPSKNTTPIENTDPFPTTPFIVNQPIVEGVVNEFRTPGKVRKSDAEAEKTIKSISDNTFKPGIAIWNISEDDLLEQLRHTDPGNRINAIRYLHKLNHADAIPILSDILLQDEDTNVRREAITALASMDGEEAFTAMVTALGDDDTSVRQHVIQALGEVASKAIPLLGQVLFSEQDPELRRQAVELIASQEGSAAQAFMSIAIQDPDEGVRQQAQFWVFEPGWDNETASNYYPTYGSAHEFASDNQFFEEFMALDSEDQTATIHELYEFDPKVAVPILNSVLSRLVDTDVRREAITALASMDGEEAFTAMVTALDDDDTSVRQHVIQALGEVGSKAIPLLGQVLFSEQDPELRRQAVELIASQEGPAAQAFMSVAIQDPDEGIRQQALFWNFEPEWDSETASNNYSTHGADTEFAADNQFFEQFMALETEDQIATIQAVLELDPKQAVPILSSVLSKDEDTTVRREAITALASMDGEEAFTAMVTALGDDDTSVRQHVMQALAEAGNKAIPLLAQVLFSEQDPKLRRQAVELIASQEGPASQTFMSIAIHDPDEGVRLTASQLSNYTLYP